MGYVIDKLKSTQITYDLSQIAGLKTQNNLEYLNQEMVCALLRWQQWFENPHVDNAAVGLRKVTINDFNNYYQAILGLLSTGDIQAEKLRPQLDELLLNTAKTILAPGPDFNRRMAILLTMGATEYHGFNSYFTDSIKQHGLDARYQNNPHIEPIYKIFKRVGANTQIARFKNDQKNYVTPSPYVAYLHSKITPKWFCYFNDKNCQAYINHDYDEACKNLFSFTGHEKLSTTEHATISNFFEGWWKKLATPNSQRIAVMPMFRDEKKLQERIKLNTIFVEKFGIEKLFYGNMYVGYEIIYTQPIKPEQIQIIEIPSVEMQQHKLSQLQDVFLADDLKDPVKTADSELTAI